MPVSNAMKNHLASGSPTALAVFMVITAKDGTTLRVWNGTRNKTVNGNVFYAYPLAPSRLQTSNGLKADNLEVVAVYSGLFSAATLRSKKWLGARVEYQVLDYKNFGLGFAERRVGFLGETSVGKFSAKPELKSLSNKLSEPSGRTFQELCDVEELGSPRCTVDLNGWTADGYRIKSLAHVVAPVLNRQQFSIAFDQNVQRGLRGRYYEGTDLNTLKIERLDQALNFADTAAPPAPLIPAGNFSARFDGTITFPFSENFNLKIVHDNGARLTINSAALINEWQTNGQSPPGTHTGVFSAAAGVPYPIVVDWNDGGVQSGFRFYWSSPSQPEQIVPASALAPPFGFAIADELYHRGRIKFLSGANAGAEQQILFNSGSDLTLYLPMFYPVQANDQVEVIAGCSRKIHICRDRFANAVNYQGFFMLPGREKVLKLPE